MQQQLSLFMIGQISKKPKQLFHFYICESKHCKELRFTPQCPYSKEKGAEPLLQSLGSSTSLQSFVGSVSLFLLGKAMEVLILLAV